MGVINSVACGPEPQSVREEIVKRGEAGQAPRWSSGFERAKAEGDLPAHVDPEGLMRVLIAMLQGISVQASQGATREELERLGRNGAGAVAERLILSPSSNFFIGRYRNLLDAALAGFVLSGTERLRAVVGSAGPSADKGAMRLNMIHDRLRA